MTASSYTTEWDASPQSSCEVIVGQFVWGVQRCMRRAYKVVNVDGDPWAICRDHYDAASLADGSEKTGRSGTATSTQ